MLENGYIKLHRSLPIWRWYKDGNVLRLWIHLLLSANYEPCSFADRMIERGELSTSLKSLSDQTGLSIKEVRTALSKLKRTGEITVWSNRHYTVITIVGYNEYQSDEANQGQTRGKPRALKGQTAGTQRATMKERKESKKARKQEESISADALDTRFSGDLLSAVQDWLAYKAERKEGYKPTGLKSLLTEISNREKQHGEQAVADVIRLSMSNGWRGIIWERIPQSKTQYSYNNTEGSL